MNENILRQYIFSLEPEIPENLRKLEEEALKASVPIIRRDTQALLRFILFDRKPGRILEIGTAVGFSASFMAHFAPENAHIDTIEKVEMRLVKARGVLKPLIEAGKVTLLEGDALEVLKGLQEKYDLIFLDAAKSQYPAYLPEIKRLMRDNALLITDNVLQEGLQARSKYEIVRRDRTTHQRMREYLYEITHDSSLETVILETGDGMSLTKLKT